MVKNFFVSKCLEKRYFFFFPCIFKTRRVLFIFFFNGDRIRDGKMTAPQWAVRDVLIFWNREIFIFFFRFFLNYFDLVFQRFFSGRIVRWHYHHFQDFSAVSFKSHNAKLSLHHSSLKFSGKSRLKSFI